jgi:1-acyl-sn-glycerol-3-phosphate acyltransferase
MAATRYSQTVYTVSQSLLYVAAKLWLRLRIEGREHVPTHGPLLAVGNHCSYADPPLLGLAVKRPVRFLAQKGLARFPPLRWWLAKVGVSLIDRSAPSKDVLRILIAALEEGACVTVFPEGTRSADGSVGPFRSGVEFLVRRTGARVVPVGIEGSFRAFPRGALFPRPRRCTVRCGPVWPAERVLASGGIEALRAEIARLANAPLRPPDGAPTRVDQGPGVLPADASPSAERPT